MAPSRSTHRTPASTQRQQQEPQIQSIPTTQLGLTPSDIQTLHHHQHLAHHHQNLAHQTHTPTPSTTPSTSSHQPHLLLDPQSLTLLSQHFDRLLLTIQHRWHTLHAQYTATTTAQAQRADQAMDDADAQIEWFERILAEIEEVGREFEKIRRIGEIVRGMRGRVEALERGL